MHRPKQVPTNTKWQFASNYNKSTMTRNDIVLSPFVVNPDSCGADRVVGGEGRFECVINATFVLDKHTQTHNKNNITTTL